MVLEIKKIGCTYPVKFPDESGIPESYRGKTLNVYFHFEDKNFYLKKPDGPKLKGRAEEVAKEQHICEGPIVIPIEAEA